MILSYNAVVGDPSRAKSLPRDKRLFRATDCPFLDQYRIIWPSPRHSPVPPVLDLFPGHRDHSGMTDVLLGCTTRQTPGRTAIVALAVAAVAIALGAACLIPDACGSFHDDGIYVVTAKALAEGRGYRLIHLPGAPLQTKYPVLYPAMLALVWKAWPSFPENLVAMHALTLLTAGAAVGLSYAYLVRYGYFVSSVAASACLLCATSPTIIYFADRLLSEMPFALLFVLALWEYDGLLESPKTSRPRQFVSGFALAAPLLCRSVGVSLIPAFLWIGWRHRRPLRWAYLGLLVIVLPWIYWTIANHGEAKRNPILGYYTDYLGWWTEIAPWNAGQFILVNALTLAISVPSVIFGVDALRWKGAVPGVLIALVLGIVALAPMARMPRTSRCLPMCLLSYLALILVWPWPPLRFLVPIAPILAALLLESVATFLRRFLPARPARLTFSALVVLAIVGNLLSLTRIHDLSHRSDYPFPSAHAEPASWSSYERVFAWIRSHTKPDDVIASGLDPTIYLYTGRTAFRPFVGRPLALFYGQGTNGIGTLEDLDRSLGAFTPRYLVQTPLVGYSEEKPFDRLIEELMGREPGRLERVYTGEDTRFVIYQVHIK